VKPLPLSEQSATVLQLFMSSINLFMGVKWKTQGPWPGKKPSDKATERQMKPAGGFATGQFNFQGAKKGQ